MGPWIRYSLVRLGIFGAVFALLYAVGLNWWVSAIFATVVSFTSSYIFLSRAKSDLSHDLQRRLRQEPSGGEADAAAEDLD